MVVADRSNRNAFPPFTDWLPTDARGQAYTVSIPASSVIAGVYWGMPVGPWVAEVRAVVFDVPSDVGTTFTLESREQPDFRVALAIETRG